MRYRLLAVIVVIVAGAGETRSQSKYPAETRNAALRYWLAFAEMHDPPADKATQGLLEKTAAGEAAWDEAKLGPILDANMDAIRTMQRSSKLPECDWGIEYSRGARASIAPLPRARVLARLNTLAGMRHMAAGDSQQAVAAWLAGIRFSEHMSRGGGLIFALIARSALLPNLQVLTIESKKGALNDSQKRQVYAVVKALPEDGLDWGAAWRLESATSEHFLLELQSAVDPGATYAALMGEPAPKQGFPPTSQEIAGYREYVSAVQAALRESPANAKTLLDQLETKKRTLGDVERSLIPDPRKSNGVRIAVVTERRKLLEALAAK